MKRYLGDSVYADTDGYHIILTTEQGDGIASNTIYLEPDVIAELNAYIGSVRNQSIVDNKGNDHEANDCASGL